MNRNVEVQKQRTLRWAENFLQDMHRDIERIATFGESMPPRLRCVHERKGHATPEFRTLVIPAPPNSQGLSPEQLSELIAHYAREREPVALLLAVDAVMSMDGASPGNVLIAEARDCMETRLFWMQPYSIAGKEVHWGDPAQGGWFDPAAEDLILDAAFIAVAAAAVPAG